MPRINGEPVGAESLREPSDSVTLERLMAGPAQCLEIFPARLQRDVVAAGLLVMHLLGYALPSFRQRSHKACVARYRARNPFQCELLMRLR